MASAGEGQQAVCFVFSGYLRVFSAHPARQHRLSVFSAMGGLFIRPHRPRMCDQLLCDLMLAKCNRQWQWQWHVQYM